MPSQSSPGPAVGADRPDPIAAWLAPILWREQDWIAALVKLTSTATRANRLTGARAYRTAIELARAVEYVDPDRRRAISSYELAGDHERARELASEVGWWSARARLSARIIDSPEHVIDEACAWWDAGHADLCALALAEVRGADRGSRGAELEALLAERDLMRHAAEAVARASAAKDTVAAAKEFMMAARFSRAAGRQDQLVRWLEAAVLADPKHPIAAPFLLELASKSRDPEPLKAFLKLRGERADDLDAWLDVMRSCALTLVKSEHYRGFGQRLVRQILQRAYNEEHPHIPGHLAMWNALAAHATTTRLRRELMPLVVAALNAAALPVDRVWLGAYAAEISLRDFGNPVVAGAYAEIVAEHAPDHPIIRELVHKVAVVQEETTNPITIPVEAIAAAKREASVDKAKGKQSIDLEKAYVDASRTRDDLVAITSEPGAAPQVEAVPTEVAKPERTAPRPFGTRPPTGPNPTASPSKGPPTPPPGAKPAPPFPAASVKPPTMPPKVAPPAISRTSTNRLGSAPVAPAATSAKPPGMAQGNRLPSLPKLPTTVPLPKVPSSIPTLAALRTAEPPAPIPPTPADPPDAKLRARRIAVPIDIRFVITAGNLVTEADGTSRDISTTGMFVLTEAALAPESELEIVMLLPGREAFTEDEYRAKARIVRKTEEGVGLELLEPSPDLVAALDNIA